MLGAILDNEHHAPECRRMFVMAGLEKSLDFCGSPSAQPGCLVSSQIACKPVFDYCPAQILARCFGIGYFLECYAARGVTGAAMAKYAHEIRPAIPPLVAVSARLITLVIHEHRIPEPEYPTLIEREGQRGLGRLLVDCFYPFHEI